VLQKTILSHSVSKKIYVFKKVSEEISTSLLKIKLIKFIFKKVKLLRKIEDAFGAV